MAETKRQETQVKSEKKEITFTCRFCGRSMPVKEMMVIARFFPSLVACRECERLLG